MDAELLLDLARHQAWADAAHWKALRENGALSEDAEIRKRLNHMAMALNWLTMLARGETPDTTATKEVDSIDELEAAMGKAQADLVAALGSTDLDKTITLPRGPNGPWEAPAGVLLLQALTHSQHHRGQNASRMRQLGATPPMTDFIIWYALGRPQAGV
ncbi:MAG: DinB family protein [Bryobacteraceae bacterium]